jgi:hypothetical protein
MVVSAKRRYCPPCVRDGDPHGRRLAGRGSVALGGFAALVQYSPTRRTYFVRSHRPAGARPKNFASSIKKLFFPVLNFRAALPAEFQSYQ